MNLLDIIGAAHLVTRLESSSNEWNYMVVVGYQVLKVTLKASVDFVFSSGNLPGDHRSEPRTTLSYDVAENSAILLTGTNRELVPKAYRLLEEAADEASTSGFKKLERGVEQAAKSGPGYHPALINRAEEIE